MIFPTTKILSNLQGGTRQRGGGLDKGGGD